MMQEEVHQGSYLTVYFPPNNTALVFLVKGIANSNFRKFLYGALPLTQGQQISSYSGGTATVSGNGQFPANAFTPEGLFFPPPVVNGQPINTYDSTDMWYIPPENNDRLFLIDLNVIPSWLRIDLQIPSQVTQSAFQVDRVAGGVSSIFGFSRGSYTTVQFPYIHYGWRFGNDTSMTVYTSVLFRYAELIVDIPRDPALIFNILTRRIPSYEITLPLITIPERLTNALKEDYGITQGFVVPRSDQSQTAVPAIQQILGKLKELT